MKKKSLLGSCIAYVVLVLTCIVVIFPLAYIFVSSFKSNAEILVNTDKFFPEKWTFSNYVSVWNAEEFDIKRMFGNSVYYTLVCVVTTLLTSSMAGYTFARGSFPWKKTIFAIFSSLMFISLGTITIYPLFSILGILHLESSINGLLVVKIFSVSIINIYLVKGYVESLPKEIDEAAEIDGCSFSGIFFKIIAPLLKPIFATIGILVFQSSWNEYLMPTLFTISRPEQRTLIVGLMALKSSNQAAASWSIMLAGTVITLIPVLFVYAVGNKYFIAGIVTGAVKG